MDPYSNDQVATVRAAIGGQDVLRGDGNLASGSTAKLADAGVLNSGVYKWRMPTGGAQGADAILAGTHTGTAPSARLYATQLDGQTIKGVAAAFPTYPGDATDWLGSITTLRGERYAIVEVTVPAASTFTPTKGEYSAL